jgi:hypothetical protein
VRKIEWGIDLGKYEDLEVRRRKSGLVAASRWRPAHEQNMETVCGKPNQTILKKSTLTHTSSILSCKEATCEQHCVERSLNICEMASKENWAHES